MLTDQDIQKAVTQWQACLKVYNEGVILENEELIQAAIKSMSHIATLLKVSNSQQHIHLFTHFWDFSKFF